MSDEPAEPTDDTALTPREAEIAALIGMGFTNQDIATELTLSVETVKSHVAHLLTKFSVRSRHQISDKVKSDDEDHSSGD